MNLGDHRTAEEIARDEAKARKAKAEAAAKAKRDAKEVHDLQKIALKEV